MYNAEAQSAPATAEQIVDATDHPNTTPTNAALYSRLGSPKAGRLLIPERIPPLRRVTLNKTDPEEMLQRYVVLTYPNSVVATVMKEKLSRDSNVIWVGENSYGEYSVTPSDPLFPWYSWYFTVYNSQWGMNSLSLGTAWDKVRGHAYLGHIDNGIQLGHPDLANLSQPWLTNFRVQFSANYATTNTSVDEDPAGSGNGAAGRGSHTAGIMAAATNNSLGVAGACWNCSLMVIKAGAPSIIKSAAISGINRTVSTGAQVLNLSFGLQFDNCTWTNSSCNCTSYPNDPLCPALAYAAAQDVVVIAASGNHGFLNTTPTITNTIQFPAADPRVIAVGGTDAYGNIWQESNPQPNFVGSNGGQNLALVAPAKDVLSTVYTNYNWNAPLRCGDNAGDSVGAGYGICTGTSMSAPHVAGIAGLLRSVNPLLTRDQIKSYLVSYASRYPNWDRAWGYGIPNANASVMAVQSTNDRLTPLFSFYSSGLENYFYTTVPQMGKAAVTGNVLPGPGFPFNLYYPYASVGTALWSYTGFPGGASQVPRAQVWVYTTHVNPFSPYYELVPLYRMSYKCGDPAPYNPICSRNYSHVDHTYTTELTGVQQYVSSGYKLDGIEGYIYPKSLSPQPGMVRLMRKYNSYRDDHAIFPESELSYMTGQGYTQNSGNTDWIGYVYPNYGYRPY